MNRALTDRTSTPIRLGNIPRASLDVPAGTNDAVLHGNLTREPTP